MLVAGYALHADAMTEKDTVPRTLRQDALCVFALAVSFFFFFQASKHVTAWARVNPFAEDPYDAVGSLSFQLAVLLGALSCIRAYRARAATASAAEQALIARGNLLCVGGLLLTFAADGIAMARHGGMWRDSTAGQSLCAVVAIFSIGAALMLWRVWRGVEKVGLLPPPLRWIPLAVAVMISLAALAAYPEHWRESFAGALLTAAVGMPILFLPLRLLAMVVPGDTLRLTTDALDDIFAYCAGLTYALRPHTHDASRRMLSQQGMPAAARFIRRFWWSFTLVAGVAIGAFLATRELAGDRAPLRRILTVAAVYMGLEGGAVLLGAMLLSRPLQLFRRPDPMRSDR